MSADGTFDPRAELDRLRSEFPRAERASEASAISGLVRETTTGTRLLNTFSVRLKRMRYNAIAAANWNEVACRGGFRYQPVMITLTEHEIGATQPNDIKEFLRHCRQWFKRRGQEFRYVWVAELQERGALHYHVVVWMPHGYRLPKPDKQGWWSVGSSRIERARNAPGYVCKYASKLKTKGDLFGQTIPKGFRMFGVGGLDREDRLKRTWANLPGWLRDRTVPEDRCKRIRGGGWIERSTGDFWPSMWKVGRVYRAGGFSFVKLVSALPEGLELCTPW